MPPTKKSNKNSITKYHQPKIWQRELKRPPSEAVASASIRMKEACDDPSGFCDLLISDACQCPHLVSWLPNMLDLNHVFCKSTTGSRSSSLVLADPVHALHMSSQLEENSTLQEPIPPNSKSSPWLYGEEQQRTVALSQPGIASGFFPLNTHHIFHQFNALNPDAPKPLHAAPPSPTKSKDSPTSSPTKQVSPSKAAASLPSQKLPETGEPATKKSKVDSTSSPDKCSSIKHASSVSFAPPLASSKEIEAAKSVGGDVKKEDAAPEKPGENGDVDMRDAEETKQAEEKAVNKDSTAKDVHMQDTDNGDKAKGEDTDNNGNKDRDTEFSVKDLDMKDAEEAKEKEGKRKESDVDMKDGLDSQSKNEEGTESKHEDEKKDPIEDEKKADSKDALDEKKQDSEGTDDEKKPGSGDIKNEKAADPVGAEEGNKSASEDAKDAKKLDSEGDAKIDKKSDPKDAMDTENLDTNDKKPEDTEEEKTPKSEGTNNVADSEASNDEAKTDTSDAKKPDSEDVKKTGTDAKDNDPQTYAKNETKPDSEDAKVAGGDAETKDDKAKDNNQTGTKEEAEVDQKKDSEVKGDEKGNSDKSTERSQEKEDGKYASGSSKKSEDDGAPNTDKDNLSTREHAHDEKNKSDDAQEAEQNTSSEDRKAEDKTSETPKTSVDKKDDIDRPEGAQESKSSEKATPTAASSSDPKGMTDSESPATSNQSDQKDKKDPKPLVTSNANNEKGMKPSSIPSSSRIGAGAGLSPTKSASDGGASATKPELLLSDARFLEISRKEEQVKMIRKLLAKRVANTKRHSKKRKLQHEQLSRQQSLLQRLPGSLQYKEERPLIEMDKKEYEEWMKEKTTANRQVEVWLEQFRASRRAYWKEQAKIKQDDSTNSRPKVSINFSEWSTTETWQRTCKLCPKSKQTFVGDEVMQCLECPFVGCSPVSIAPKSRNQHILQHMFLSGHKFAVTCGARADVFCFPCGDFVYHKLFDQERERLDLEAQIPWLSWNDHPLQRSFDPLQFAQVEEYGILWRGLMATYPPLVPPEHTDASKLCILRQALFEGRVKESDWLLMGRRALDFSIHQNETDQDERYKIPYPIGMYNLGNTCFMSAVLQCFIHCPPFQRYFLKDIGHHHKACMKYRAEKSSKDASDSICLACEMDSLMLEYYSRSTGRNVSAALNDLSAVPRRSVMDLMNEISTKDEEMIDRGEPIVITRMLTIAWKSSGMGHLAGYEQRDAHEFLHAFLDILGKQICKYRAKVDTSIALARAGSRFKREQEPVHHDVIKHLFEGKLRSVLVCQDCGTKRTLSEVFLNISLPLLKELVASQNTPGAQGAAKLSLDRCLQHFTSPETLADPVDCPACRRKTTTKKQHTFSKLPRVLCVHLKRFHAALNKKIEDFVSFPARGLNMGSHLPHWREVTTVPKEASIDNPQSAEPEILYDLFGTVNHHGNLQSGHYTVNVRIGKEWFRINDQHVSKSTEATVLTNDGAYILFYRRR